MESVNNPVYRMSRILTQKGACAGNSCLLLTSFLVVPLLFWLLNPYACCPEDTTAAMRMTFNHTGDYQSSMTGSGLYVSQDSSPSTVAIDYLPRGTPGSLPEPTPSLTAPVLARHNQVGLWVKTILTTNEEPLSEIVLPSVPPPRA